MKPRPEMVAVPVDTTVEQFIEMLRTKPFSRVPVIEGSIHNIMGIVYAQDVLQVPDSEAHARTVESLMRKDVYFVPESKLGSDLLREMRRTTSAWRSWWMSTAASRGWSRSKTWSRKSSARSATSTKSRR